MTDVTRQQLGDSGAHAPQNSKLELSGSDHQSSAFRALHHEAVAALSSPSESASIVNMESGLTRPSVQTAESVHIALNSDGTSLAPKQDLTSGAKLDSVDKSKANDGRLRSKDNPSDLGSLIPQYLLDEISAGQRNAATAPALQFDTSKSIADLVSAGAIVDGSSKFNDAQAENNGRPKLAPGEVPQVTVSLEDPSDKNAKPDFVIHTDGAVEMLSNPQATGQKNIAVQFERQGDQVELTDSQKQAGGKFYDYLQTQLKGQFPDAAADAFKTRDEQGLLKDTPLPAEVKQNIEAQQQRADIPADSGLPERAEPTMQDTRRITQGGSGSEVSRSEVNDMTPPAQPLPNEADRMQAMKDTVASYVTRGEQHPYDYVASRGDRGWGIGRYGMTYSQIGQFISGLTEEQIQTLVKQGKLSAEQARNLEKLQDSIKHAQETGDDKDLDPFLKAMKNGEGTAAEMREGVQQFMPAKVQELAASEQISKITGDLSKGARPQIGADGKSTTPSVNPGQLALSFVLGHTVNNLEADANPEYKNFVLSANQAYRLQEQSRTQDGGMIHVENMREVASALNHMVGQQFWREAAAVTEYGNLGCAIAATRMLQHLGVQIGAHLDVNGAAADMRHRGWQQVPLAEAERSGQLYVAAIPGTHVGLGLGNQVWENDSSLARVITHNMGGSSLRSSTWVFIVPIRPGGNADAA